MCFSSNNIPLNIFFRRGEKRLSRAFLEWLQRCHGLREGEPCQSWHKPQPGREEEDRQSHSHKDAVRQSQLLHWRLKKRKFGITKSTARADFSWVNKLVLPLCVHFHFVSLPVVLFSFISWSACILTAKVKFCKWPYQQVLDIRNDIQWN